MVASAVALPLMGGAGLAGEAGENGDGNGVEGDVGGLTADVQEDATAESGLIEMEPAPAAANADETEAGSGDSATDGELIPNTGTGDTAQEQLSQANGDAVEAGVDEGIELAQSQGVEVSQEQRSAAIESAGASAEQHQEASVEQVQEATKGAVHGSLMQSQEVEIEQFQSAVGGATSGALSQHQTVNASQMQSATWGAAHGGLAQEQRVTVEQIQVATHGAAAGAAGEAGEKEIDRKPKIQEAAQGAAYGALDQYQKITAEQRQQVTVEHVQHAAAGAAAGALDGTSDVALEQEQQIEIEQRQQVDIKQVQKAATGAAKGALVQKQQVTVEQTQSAARGAGKGSLLQVQSVEIEQVQRISITQIQEAAFGASKGAIEQSQEATIEQIQAAATGGAQGTLVQHQEVSITQIQHAALGASKGAVESAVQHQVVEIEQIQAAAYGAGEGAVLQTQIVDVTQVQSLAAGSSSGVLSQHQEATATQIQTAAKTASQETARAVQYQRVSVTQLQTLTQETAADATAYAVAEGIDDEVQLVQYVEIEVVQKIEEIDELEGTATITFADQEGDGESVVVDDVELSEGGFVAIYDGVAVDADPDSVIGVSDYLEPGEHENLTVELDEPLAESQPLVAVVHHDTTGDETFQYVDSDGADDEPYVADGGGPVLDGAFVTVDEPDEPAEPEASLSVSDQAGDGESLLVDEANASVEYIVTAEYDGERVDSESFEAGETIENESIDLEPPIEENTTVDVAVRATEDDAELAAESIEYTLDVEDDPTEPEASLSVSDQEGDGETLLVDEANASVEYELVVTDQDGEQRGESGPFEATQTVENESVDLEPTLESDAELEVAVVSTGPDAADGTATADGEPDNGAILDDGPTDGEATTDGEEAAVLESETIQYTLVDEPTDVEFVDCQRVEVTDTFEDGETIIVATAFYESSGIGNTLGEYAITVGEDVDAPFEGTVTFEVGEEFTVTETDEGATVEVPPGEFGAAITGISSPEAIPGEIDYPNPDSADCLAEVRPELPVLDVADATPTEDAIEVTFEYENPNDAELIVDSRFTEGTTEDEPVEALSADDGSFTVEWTPQSDDEQLVWLADMSNYDYDEADWPTATTATAGEIDPGEPEFAVTIAEPPAPVEQGEPVVVDAEIENVGDGDGTQAIEFAIGDTVVSTTTVTLDSGASQVLSFEAGTDGFEPGEYTATVSSENEVVETTVVVEAPEEPEAEEPAGEPGEDGIGEDGQDGAPGEGGEPGEDGVGEDGEDGEDGEIVFPEGGVDSGEDTDDTGGESTNGPAVNTGPNGATGDAAG
ncbi:CARDB domain-containing protein [Natrialbaceae archaeon A-arb3/5]